MWGGLQEGGGFPIYFYMYMFERGWLKRNSVKEYGVAYKKGAYKSEYGMHYNV